MTTPQEQEQQRIELIERVIPNIKQLKGHMLYIGGAPGKVQLVNYFKPNFSIVLLEADRSNLEGIATENVFDECYLGDVRNIGQMDLGHFDLVVWWHGPEHVYLHEMIFTLHALYNISDHILLGCPYGYYPQDAWGGNIYERHLAHYTPEDFNIMGFWTGTIGRFEGGNDSCLIAWR